MGLEEGGGGGRCFPPAPRACDSCQMAAALLFCQPESAFLCIACDEKLHDKMGLRHERVSLCEVCEHEPANVTCKADAAALCAACDRDIHSANPLARRHERIPVAPFYGSAGDDCSWLIPSTAGKLAGELAEMKPIEWLFPDSDKLLDFDYPIPFHSSGSDSVVPVQTKSLPPAVFMNQIQPSDKCFEIDFTNSKLCSYNVNINSYSTQSTTQSVSSSSLDVGVDPEGSSISDSSYPFGHTINSAMDTSGSINTTNCHGKDREARVLRYREKRKNRRFEKTIRYASRKAYAETRPRIKGRFAKRLESEEDAPLDRMFGSSGDDSSAFISDTLYGVVPSF